MEDILVLLEEIGTIPEYLQVMISDQKDLEVLRKWHKLAARVQSIEELERKIPVPK